MNRDTVLIAATMLKEALEEFTEASSVARKERARRPIEARLESRLAKAFRAQGNAFLSRFSALKSKLPSEDFSEAVKPKLDWEKFYNASADAVESDFIAAITDAAETALQVGAKALLSDLKMNVAFSLKNPRAVAYIKARGAENVTAISETTREYLRTIITEGVEQGWSYGRLAARIRERFEEFADGTPITASRARIIAVTETGNAYEAGNMVVADDLVEGGLKMEKSWNTAQDDRVDDICATNEAEGWIPIDQAHASGDMHPLAHPNCRCNEQYRRVGSQG